MSMIVDSAANRIFQEFDAEFLKAIDQAERVWPGIGMEIPSSSRSTLHAWLLNQAKVREWKGARYLNEMGSITWEVINRDFELSFQFHQNQIRDDLSGLVALAVREGRAAASKWAKHEDLLVAETIQAGTSKDCYDGQYFFSAAHPVDPLGITSGTFSNLNTGRALTAANLQTSLKQLRQIKAPDGSPWVGPGSKVKLVVEASKEWEARQLLTLGWFSGTAAAGLAAASAPSENVLRGSCELVVDQYLNSEEGVWYLVAEVDGIKPIMFQRRQGVETQEQGPGSHVYFESKVYKIGHDARYEASYTHPQLMQRNEP